MILRDNDIILVDLSISILLFDVDSDSDRIGSGDR